MIFSNLFLLSGIMIPPIFPEWRKSPFIKELKKLPRRNLMDISKLDSWGVRTYKDGTEQLIIIDSGLCLKSMLKND